MGLSQAPDSAAICGERQRSLCIQGLALLPVISMLVFGMRLNVPFSCLLLETAKLRLTRRETPTIK
jgi:hypothetical protein